MQNLNLFSIYLDKMENLRIDYFITGSVASIVYGQPRLTHDIDLVVSLIPEMIDKIVSEFNINEFYCPPEEVIKSEIKRESNGRFNIIHHETGFKADIYLIGNDPFQKWAMENRRSIQFYDKNIFIAPPEYLIIKKLEFYKEGNGEKHLTDIKAVIKYSGDLIDYNFLLTQIKNKNLSEIWSKLEIKPK
ncbi:MAG: hypothetical protein RDU14_07065 [Melioribacteraceae bacterium]|nr:hypothetical protein [Melioribacteraceae bacterium]